MKLRGSGTKFDDLFDKQLATIDVATDDAEDWGDGRLRRTITGTITETSEHWQRFLEEWTQLGGVIKIDGQDEKDFINVRNLQIDYDHYGFHSCICVEGKELRF